jgi:3-hydroxypropanoate dehydrogenase
MSGFDNAGVDKAFFSGTRIESNFICSIGHNVPASVFPRNPRLSFEEAGRWAQPERRSRCTTNPSYPS